MYKLILVSDKQEIRELYLQFRDWNNLGFEQPTIASGTEEAVAFMNKERFDAVSSLLSISESRAFYAYLSKKPEMLGIETARDEERLRKEIGTARRTLSARDAGRQKKQVDDLISVMRHDFFYDLLRGTYYDREKIDERIRSLKIQTIDPSRPVAIASFRLPQGDYFLSEVWRYGKERLENALKNIFERTDEHSEEAGDFIFLLLFINPHHMRVLSIPTRDMEEEEVYTGLVQHLDKCGNYLEEYFELGMVVKRINHFSSLYDLALENRQRLAH